ncbi:hypothetical protein KL86CLO1_11060 [uncultured Eubacteriales bacterium]|uniref:Uncharacterized protein n=1 Tax=uncultured Eubacteriales bacterium TaxID=172733 RepID=A0A212JGK0_9FIRM|nr:hypothetical protein KL86CLO1_11060 [uncultured Eubacteriales bacterium]
MISQKPNSMPRQKEIYTSTLDKK